jgi:hypothetical protein
MFHPVRLVSNVRMLGLGCKHHAAASPWFDRSGHGIATCAVSGFHATPRAADSGGPACGHWGVHWARRSWRALFERFCDVDPRIDRLALRVMPSRINDDDGQICTGAVAATKPDWLASLCLDRQAGEFEVMIRPIKALRPLRDEIGNRIGPQLAPPKQLRRPRLDGTVQDVSPDGASRACATGALVARIGRLAAPPEADSRVRHAAVAQW